MSNYVILPQKPAYAAVWLGDKGGETVTVDGTLFDVRYTKREDIAPFANLSAFSPYVFNVKHPDSGTDGLFIGMVQRCAWSEKNMGKTFVESVLVYAYSYRLYKTYAKFCDQLKQHPLENYSQMQWQNTVTADLFFRGASISVERQERIALLLCQETIMKLGQP